MNGERGTIAVTLAPEAWERAAHALEAKASILEDIVGHDPAWVRTYRALAREIRTQVADWVWTHGPSADPAATLTRLVVRVPDGLPDDRPARRDDP